MEWLLLLVVWRLLRLVALAPLAATGDFAPRSVLSLTHALLLIAQLCGGAVGGVRRSVL